MGEEPTCVLHCDDALARFLHDVNVLRWTRTKRDREAVKMAGCRIDKGSRWVVEKVCGYGHHSVRLRVRDRYQESSAFFLKVPLTEALVPPHDIWNRVPGNAVEHWIEGTDGVLPMQIFFDGESLQDRLERGQLLGPLEVCRVLDQALKVLEASHEAGLIHGRLSPRHVLIGESEIRICGWSGAQELASENVSFGKHVSFESKMQSVSVGSWIPALSYVAPEHFMALIKNESLYEASDLFSLAMVFFQASCGVIPQPRAVVIKLRHLATKSITGLDAAELLEVDALVDEFLNFRVNLDELQCPVDIWTRVPSLARFFMTALWDERFETAGSMRAALSEIRSAVEAEDAVLKDEEVFASWEVRPHIVIEKNPDIEEMLCL